MYASFLGISEALHMDIFHQPLKRRFFDSLVIGIKGVKRIFVDVFEKILGLISFVPLTSRI
jgi:hypothetical protein